MIIKLPHSTILTARHIKTSLEPSYMQKPNSAAGSLMASRRSVCFPCKIGKRKCDKIRPKCSLCLRKKLHCEYQLPLVAPRSAVASASSAASAPTPTPAAPPAPSSRSLNSINNDSDLGHVPGLDFPTILFLDPGILQNGQVEVCEVASSVPEHILQLLGDLDDFRATASKFFKHIHLWMPFISRKRFYELYLRSPSQSQSDVILLFLSLKLITTLPSTNARSPRTPLYYAVKQFHLQIECSSVLSLPVLQAAVLVAIYELGHGIYPAAFLSVGACVRYAHALGIGCKGSVQKQRVLTLIEVEERRRTWWAIVILDRFVSIGCPGRPFAAADPTIDEFLPIDDTAWDRGIIRADDYRALSSPSTGHMSRFALLCQAARLLGQVLDDVSNAEEIRDDTWMQLDRTLQSMITAALNVESPDYDQISFIYSALIALYTPWLYSDGSSTVHKDRFVRAKVVVQQITETISINLVDHQCFLGRNPEDISPWGLFFAYHVSGVNMQSHREARNESEVVKSLKEAFREIDVRWNVAGVYLRLLEAREVRLVFDRRTNRKSLS